MIDGPCGCAEIAQHSPVCSFGISYPKAVSKAVPPQILSLKTGFKIKAAIGVPP
jgi:hypothetical protein